MSSEISDLKIVIDQQNVALKCKDKQITYLNDILMKKNIEIKNQDDQIDEERTLFFNKGQTFALAVKRKDEKIESLEKHILELKTGSS